LAFKPKLKINCQFFDIILVYEQITREIALLPGENI